MLLFRHGHIHIQGQPVPPWRGRGLFP
jgi:hypothetical protein